MEKNHDFHSFYLAWWKKILLIMRITGFLCLVCMMHLSAATYSQTARVNLKMDNATIEQVFAKITESTQLDFFYNNSELDVTKKVSVNFTDATIDHVLKVIFKGKDVKYEVTNSFVVIHYVKDVKEESTGKVVKGVVRDKQKELLPGVTVMIKGSKLGVSTNVKGEFSITTVEKDSLILVFSFVGMKTKEVKVDLNKLQLLNVVLEEASQAMDEVVVTGYQQVKKRSMAGSSSSVKGTDLVLTGTQTLEQALQGKLPGVMVMNQSGLTGVRQKVRVRGTATLVGNPEPVWVVDGIIQEDPLPFNAAQLTDIGTNDNMDIIKNFVGGAIAWLNPSDIDNIVVLKDASATAIYGVKAANGVIVITTKKGEKGRMSVSYNGSFSTSTRLNYNDMELMNSKQRVEVSREAYERGCLVTSEDQIGYMSLALAYKRREISYETFNAEVKKLETQNTDWFDILFRTPFSHNHSISISGGGDKFSYRGSFGISDQKNTARKNGSTQYRGNLNISSVLWDCLTLDGGLSGSVSKTTAYANILPYAYASTTNRAIACYQENGELYYYPKGENNYLYNILNEMENSGNKNSTNSLNANLNLRWRMAEGFTLSSVLGYNYSTSYGELWYTDETNYITAIRTYEYGEYGPNDQKFKNSPLPYGGELNVTESRNNNYTWRNQLEFNRLIGLHTVSAMIGQEIRSNKYDGFAQKNYGYMHGRGKSFASVPLTYGNATSPQQNHLYARTVPTITDRKANYLSFYGNCSYMFDERYALNASIRMDASNRFGQDKSTRFQPVWSVGVRWNLTKEHWLENQELLNDVSFRASYGYQGNVAENVSPDLVTKFVSKSQYGNNTGVFTQKISKLPTPELKWEKTKTVNLGVDFSILKSKLNGSFEYYTKRTEDMIVAQKVALENGVANMPINGGSMKNSGWELNLSVVPVRVKDFVWNLGINTSKVYNKVKSNLEPTGDWKSVVGGSFFKNGYPVSSFWAFRFSGLNPENGSPQYDLSSADTEAAKLDVTQYMVYAGKLEPDFTAGLNTSFRYKTLTLSANFYLSIGGKKFLHSPFDSFNRIPSEYTNLSKELLERWRNPGDEAYTNIPSLPTPTNSLPIYPFKAMTIPFYPYEAYGYSDIRVVNAWFLRCSNLTLAYTVPQNWVSHFAQNVAVSLSVSNPFQIVSRDFHGRDPEVAQGMQPMSRDFSLSVSMSF